MAVTTWWRLEHSRLHDLLDWLVPGAGVGIVVAFGASPYHAPWSSVWIVLLSLYVLFYCRLARIGYWSWNTFHNLQRHLPTCHRSPAPTVAGTRLPTFHILIAAYDAPSTIGPVLRAIEKQDYPTSLYTTWVITERLEEERKTEAANALAAQAAAVAVGRHLIEPSGAKRLLCAAGLQAYTEIDALVSALVGGTLTMYARDPDTCDDITSAFCFLTLLDEPSVVSSLSNSQSRLPMQPTDYAVLMRELTGLEATVARTCEDFGRILGDEVYTRLEIASQLLSAGVLSRRVRRACRDIWNRLPSAGAAGVDATASSLSRSARALTPSTQDALGRMDAVRSGRVRHLNPRGRGAKPGALNAAFREIRAEGLLDRSDNVYFLIIDSDSLLPVHALGTLAGVLTDLSENPGIVQLAAIPTANFYCGNWYSHFVAISDAIGALGKWSRNTRRLLRPDLNAGSGVVVPASLAEHIANHAAGPWDEGTMTEDARMIVGQFGSTGGARNTTTMAPIYLLEAVPHAPTLRETFKAFWNQRRRWTIGGVGEIGYLLRTPSWVLFSRFRSATRQWEVYQPSAVEWLVARLRQLIRLASWIWDHFLWGLGGLIVLTHWWGISLMFAEPTRHLREIAGVGLIVAPLLFLLGPGRQVQRFIPGGVSRRHQCRLFVLSFVAIWMYCLPVAFYQLVCLCGLRSRIVGWKPTPKPFCRFGAIGRPH